VFIVAMLGALTPSSVARADSATAPDSTQLDLVRFALKNYNEVRVIGKDTDVLGRHGEASAGGVALRVDANSIAIQPTTIVPWAQIETIRVRKGSTGTGPIIGGVLGLLAGAVIGVTEIRFSDFLSSHPRTTGTAKVGFTILGCTVAGGSLGYLVEHPSRWKTVYP
jgi:hypothetical protein